VEYYKHKVADGNTEELMFFTSSSGSSILYVYLRRENGIFTRRKKNVLEAGSWRLMRNHDAVYILQVNSPMIRSYELDFKSYKFLFEDITGSFPPEIAQFRCREYELTDQVREKYPFRCVGFAHGKYYMYAFNVTMTEPVDVLQMPLLDEMDRKPDNRFVMDFLSNGFNRKRASYSMGGSSFYDVYDFSKGERIAQLPSA
jgi:hypothetical protein